MSESKSPADWTVFTAAGFPKELARLPRKIRERVHEFVFQVLVESKNPFDITNLDKLRGPGSFYKVRFGNYRLGLEIVKEKKQVHVLRVLHRRDIYRHFP
jgi:mRNA interferase RelE/StbE